MLNGIHFLLTYNCNYECDHCFLYCGPNAEGTFTLKNIKQILDEAEKLGSIEWIYFEGGEPYLYYPLMLESVRLATEKGYKTGIVSNGYWGTSVEDAELWLKPLAKLGLANLGLSEDVFHYGDEKNTPARAAYLAAKKLNIPVDKYCIEMPEVISEGKNTQDKGAPVIGGNVLFKGRAVEKLTKDLPKRSWLEFTECPHEELVKPQRVHIDPFGWVHICQGLCMGKCFKTPLSEMVRNYDAKKHPICKYLIDGGPARLVKEYNVEHEDKYVDECHLCFLARKNLLDKFPDYLAPHQVYGLSE